MQFLKPCSVFWSILNVILLVTNTLQAQQKDYFQQKVDYNIQVTLDDEAHYLRGNVEMQYHNNSHDTLTVVYFHVWPNAYKNKQTAFAQQLLNQGRLDFHFSKPNERGFMDSLDFSCNNQTAQWHTKEGQIDVVVVKLPQPLAPKDSMTISTPFRVKLPSDFSRLAHKGQAYMICQWYPKPAVYDHEGWHPMSYLDYGEFYSEFGNYKVQITLPSNYVVGATGELKTSAEYAFLKKRAAETAQQKKFSFTPNTFPPSDKTQKTLLYEAQQVHDFAWFADKRYWVEMDTFALASGRRVKSYILYTSAQASLWSTKAQQYTERAVKFYSNTVGEYPYDNVTVAQGIYKGSDMEYPTVTVIGNAFHGQFLDNVITHEVGHNWFYGILGSNERIYAWMDEGFNSYLDMRYTNNYYEYNFSDDYLDYVEAAREHKDQATNSPTAELSNYNYFLCGYGKPVLAFQYLEQYLGTEEMDRLLKLYYEKWKFKHPYPQDLRAIFEQNSSKDIRWFFNHLIDSNGHLDYATTRYRCCNKHNAADVTVKNTGDFAAPIPLAVVDEEGKRVKEIWIEQLPQGKDTTIQLPIGKAYQLDYDRSIPEINRNNNVIRSRGVFKKGVPLKFKFGTNLYNFNEPSIFLLPLLGFNLYDGLQIGGLAYNHAIPERKWDYAFASFFTTHSLTWTGFGELKHHSYIKRHKLVQGLRFKSFHKRRKKYTENRPYKFSERYTKITPYLRFEFAKPTDKSLIEQSIELSAAFILEEKGKETRTAVGSQRFLYQGKKTTWRPTVRLIHTYKNKQRLAPFRLRTQLEYAQYTTAFRQEQYLQLSSELNARFLYSKYWGLDLRIFAGGFLWHTNREFGAFPLVLIGGNRKDYHYDDYWLGRREQENIAAQQVALRGGGFKTAIEAIQFAGASNTFIMAVNLKTDIPIKLPFRIPYLRLKPFLDLGYHQITDPVVQVRDWNASFMASAGLMLDIGNGIGGIYLPLLATNNLQQKVNSFAKNAFYRRITFSFNFNPLTKKKIIKRVTY